MHVSGIARTVVSFCDDILNSNESNKTYLTANVSNFLIADLKMGVCSVIDINIGI